MVSKPNAEFEVRTQRDGSRVTLMMVGEIDGRVAATLADAYASLRGEGARELLIDLDGVSFIDSAGLRAIVDLEHAARRDDVSLRLGKLPTGVGELLRSTGLSGRLTPGPQAGSREPGGVTERIEVTLPRDLRAAARARAEIREAMPALSSDELAVAVLLTSEVVTNAVVHTRPEGQDTIRLVVQVAADWVGVQVVDPGPGFEPQRPIPRPPEKGGRGLLLVDHLASRWGAAPAPTPSGWFSVWFEIDLGTVTLPAAGPMA